MSGPDQRTRVTDAWWRPSRIATVLLAAIGSFGLEQAQAQSGLSVWTGGGLPPSIAKPNPSAEVPADLPSPVGASACRLPGEATVYAPAGRAAIIGIDAGALLPSGSCPTPGPSRAASVSAAPRTRPDRPDVPTATGAPTHLWPGTPPFAAP